MMRAQRFALVLAGSSVFAAAPLAAQETWTWNGTIPAGRTIEIKGINGNIRAVAGNGNEVRVRAIKKSEHGRSSLSDVRMEVVEHDGGVTICAVYPHRRDREPNECRPGSRGRTNVENNDVTVSYEVQVPRGVNFMGRTVNGGVEATGLTGEAHARTVNGGIKLATRGIASAHTVNGGIDVDMGRADWADELSFETTNGSIVVRLPANINAQVNASTVTGNIETDFPLEVRGRFGNRRVSGTIGSGGRELSLSTVNGGISIKRL